MSVSQTDTSSFEQPQFGASLPGRIYVDRPGVYRIALRGSQVLIVEMQGRFYLSGGGAIEGETPEQCLRREVLEETGQHIDGFDEIGMVRQYVVETEYGRGFNKVATFFAVTFAEGQVCNSDVDHESRWNSVADAIAGLAQEAQSRGVHRAMSARRAARREHGGVIDE